MTNTDAYVRTTRMPTSVQHGCLHPYNTDAYVRTTRTPASTFPAVKTAGYIGNAPMGQF
ncbi:MAG: hypothetical protein LBP87_08120 [Planctomycetaceae bacterium]|nr:hypothetical protein [Planctomycetaceae bacterium]